MHRSSKHSICLLSSWAFDDRLSHFHYFLMGTGVAKHLAPFLPGHPVIPVGGEGTNVVVKTHGKTIQYHVRILEVPCCI